MRKLFIFLVIVLIFSDMQAQNLYFPPIGSATWETTDPQELGWCQPQIDSLYDYLDETNTLGFIILKDGKIVLEKYFGIHTSTSLWYWASAAKSLTGFIAGMAQHDGLIDINAPTSTYLGEGWTSCTSTQEEAITIRHQLMMTSGLDPDVPNSFCTDDTCLIYLADPGTKWYYHNAPFTLIEAAIENAAGQTYNQITTSWVKNPAGMTGLWIPTDFYNVYWSDTRSMARFGLLSQNNGIWDSDTLMYDQQYFYDMTHPSQDLNKAYGYLWWLNTNQGFMIPGTSLAFPGQLFPAGPEDMYSALGLDGQICSVSPSEGLVVVRMGGNPGFGLLSVPTIYANEIWERVSQLDCGTIATETPTQNNIKVYPTLTDGRVVISAEKPVHCAVFDAFGRRLFVANSNEVDLSNQPAGVYHILTECEGKVQTHRVVKL